MDLSVQTIHLYLSVCSFTFGMFHYITECGLCSDGQFLISFLIISYDDDCHLILIYFCQLQV